MNNTILENTCCVKQEFEDTDCFDDKIYVFETTTNISHIEAEDSIGDCKFKGNEASISEYIKEEPSSLEVDNTIIDFVKIEDQNRTADIKIEFANRLFCDHCQAYYEDYCIKCGMLVHILNSNIYNNAREEMPENILEVSKNPGYFGIFALKRIPEGVRFGPFTGLSLSERPLKLKGGKLMVSEDKATFLNWMRYVNRAKDAFEQNLRVFHWEDNLYYRSSCEIHAGEELLVHFGDEYEDSVDQENEVDFVPVTEDDVGNVFACTFCCLGFSSKLHLLKHKTICFNEVNGKFSIPELTQCPCCKIYFYEKEYLEYHKPYCSERNVRKCIPLALDNQTAEVNRRRSVRFEMYKCTQCKYRTAFEADLKNHVNKHYEVKMYRCEVGYRQFKTNKSLKLHVKSIHVGVDGNEDKKCSMRDYKKANAKAGSSNVHDYLQNKARQCPKCEYQTRYKNCFEKHVKTKHLEEFDYKCEICDCKTSCKSKLDYHVKTKHLKEFSYNCEMCKMYKTNNKSHLEEHIKTKHLKEFDYNCEKCEYKTNKKSHLNRHIKMKHLKFSYKCEMCDFQTSVKSHLERHIKTKHLKEFSYICEICDYKTNNKQALDEHMKTKHLKEFDYMCELCNYKTNNRSHLEEHIKTKHLKEFDYNCEMCDYKANRKENLKIHIKTKHLKRFDYNCEICDYKTNKKSHLERHIKIKHLKECRYECEICAYKTNYKTYLQRHIKTKHLKEFDYNCEMCDYKTNLKYDLEVHIRTKHLNEFDYKCEVCDYKTICKSKLDYHVKTKHLKEFDYNCEECDFKTNDKSHLEKHIKTKHLKEFDYKCEVCDYKTNLKHHIETHIKSKHLKEFNYECELCDYKTNSKSYLGVHTKTKHLKEFDYKCEICDYKTNDKTNLENHTKSKHLKEFSYACEICNFKTNDKSHLKRHIRNKHKVH